MTRVLLSRYAATLIEAQLRELPLTPVFLGGDTAGAIGDIDIAWASSDVYWDADARQQLFGAVQSSATLRWLHTNSSGVDGSVMQELLRRGVTLTRSDVHAPAIAEYVLRAVLDWFQRPQEWRASARAREWRKTEFREVLGTTWLVIGMGTIGSEVATRARAFGAHVIGVRRTPLGTEPVDEMLEPQHILDAVPRADVVVLAAPASPTTVGMVGEEFLRSMRPGSVLVNVARGSLVDEPALLEALDRGTPDAALLDVAATEPPPQDSALWTHPRIVLTPHTSGHGTGHHARAAALFAENLVHFLAGEPLVKAVTS